MSFFPTSSVSSIHDPRLLHTYLFRPGDTSTDDTGKLLLADGEEKTDAKGDGGDEGNRDTGEEPEGSADVELRASGAAPVVHETTALAILFNGLAAATREARTVRARARPLVRADAVAGARGRRRLARVLGCEAARYRARTPGERVEDFLARRAVSAGDEGRVGLGCYSLALELELAAAVV